MSIINENETENKTVAKVYLSFKYYHTKSMFEPDADGAAISVTVTNLKNETRYFDQPCFKPSIPFDETADAFVMLNMVQPINFPVRLEFGEQYSVSYKLGRSNIELFRSLLDKDPSATIKASVSTTLGESSESEPYKVSEIIENYCKMKN